MLMLVLIYIIWVGIGLDLTRVDKYMYMTYVST